MKVDTYYGSIWDEMPGKPERTIPKTQEEALDLYEAAKSSINHSLMKTWDAHNDMVKKSAELRNIKHRKEAIERLAREQREEHTEFLEESSLKRKG